MSSHSGQRSPCLSPYEKAVFKASFCTPVPLLAQPYPVETWPEPQLQAYHRPSQGLTAMIRKRKQNQEKPLGDKNPFALTWIPNSDLSKAHRSSNEREKPYFSPFSRQSPQHFQCILCKGPNLDSLYLKGFGAKRVGRLLW